MDEDGLRVDGCDLAKHPLGAGVRAFDDHDPVSVASVFAGRDVALAFQRVNDLVLGLAAADPVDLAEVGKFGHAGDIPTRGGPIRPHASDRVCELRRWGIPAEHSQGDQADV
jgi:hypothetical protein